MRTVRTALFSRALPSITLLGVALLGTSCSSAPAAVDAPATTASASAGPVARANDLSPVPAPQGIFASGRAKSVKTTLTTLGLASSETEATTAVLKEILGSHGIRLDVDPARAASVLALDAPVDFVAAMPGDGPPEPMIAVAVGLKSVEEARTALGAQTEFAPGMWAMSGGERAKGFCVVAASSGPTPARAVCGPSERDVQALGAYLARTKSIEVPGTSDAFIELSVASINTRFGKDAAKLATQAPRLARNELGIGEPQFDKAIETAAKGLTDEALALLGDVDKVRFDATLSQQGGVTLDGSIDYKSQNSWIAKTAAQSIIGPPPPFFFRAPIDADSVAFGTVRDPADYSAIFKVGKDLVEGGLARAKIGSEAERKKVSALLDLPLAKGEQFVTASGSRQITKSPEGKSIQEKMQTFVKGQVGWTLIGTNQKAETMTKWLRDAAAAFNQAGIQKVIKKELNDVNLTVKTPAAPAKLGNGAFALELSFSGANKKPAPVPVPPKGNGKDKKPPPPQPKPAADANISFSVFVLVMPDGDGSWVAIGANKDELVERLLEVKTGAAKDKTLESRSDTQVMRTLKVASAGFVTLRSFRSLVGSALLYRSMNDSDPLNGQDQVEAFFAKLPNKGETPIVYQGTVTTAPNGPSSASTCPRHRSTTSPP